MGVIVSRRILENAVGSSMLSNGRYPQLFLYLGLKNPVDNSDSHESVYDLLNLEFLGTSKILSTMYNR